MAGKQYEVESFGNSITIKTPHFTMDLDYNIHSNNVERFTALLNALINDSTYHMSMGTITNSNAAGFKCENGKLEVYSVATVWGGSESMRLTCHIPKEDAIVVVKDIISKLWIPNNKSLVDNSSNNEVSKDEVSKDEVSKIEMKDGEIWVLNIDPKTYATKFTKIQSN